MPLARVRAALVLWPLLVLAGCVVPNAGADRETPAVTRTGESKDGSGASTAAPAPEKTATANDEKQPEPEKPADRTHEPEPVAAGSGVEAERPPPDLVAQLNEAARELGVLRANYAKLKAERNPAPAVRAEAAPLPDPNEEKLSARLKTYAQFKQDLAGFLDEADKLRAENTALGTQVKELTAQNQETLGTLARVKAEAQEQRELRERAEQNVEKLRDQLHAIARALSAAGLSLDTLSETRDPTATLKTSPERLQSAAKDAPPQ